MTPLGALEASAFGEAMRRSPWLYPAVQIAHVVGVAILVGSIAVLDLRLLGWSRARPVRRLAARPEDARLGCACGYVHWDNPLPVVAAIVEHEGAVILARNKAWPEKMFGLITGFLEQGETPEAGVVREVREELALEALDSDLVGIYPFARRNELIIAYHVPARGEIRLNEELADFRRVAPDKLRAWDFGTGLAVADWLRRRRAPIG